MTLRYLLGTRRVYPMALLSFVPFVLALSLSSAGVENYDLFLFQLLMIPLFFQVVLTFITVVNATVLVREEIEDNTLAYLLTRPLSKPAIAVYKYLGYLIAVVVLTVPPIALGYAVTQTYTGSSYVADLDVLGALVLATVLGSAAYGAVFLLLSVVFRKPLAFGLLYGFIWESIVGSIPGDVPKLSMIYYLKSLMKDMVGSGPLVGFPTDTDAGWATVILIAVSIAMVALALFQLQQMEFREKA